MKHMLSCSAILILTLIASTVPSLHSADKPHPEAPRAHDPRLCVDLFAAPDIVHPIAVKIGVSSF
jgi:hypothetical protein